MNAEYIRLCEKVFQGEIIYLCQITKRYFAVDHGQSALTPDNEIDFKNNAEQQKHPAP